MPRWVKILAGLAIAGAVAGFVVAWSGAIHVGASTGHWKITEWLLHWAMRQSVETHSMGTEIPPLDDPALARRGAGHYAAACAPCHGAPGLERSAVVLGMTPQPPFLPEKVRQWQAEELFWIVRHGVKFTGMPAWPALQREDEVWAMVAFLRRMPELDETGYRRLAFGEARHSDGTEPSASRPGQAGSGPAERALAGCVRCHGRAGEGGGAFPRLAGQNEDYLYASLKAYSEARRFSGFMQTAVSGLDDAAMRALAKHYAAAESAGGKRQEGVNGSSLGERIARHGDPARGVPACSACHGLAAGPRYPAYPSLAGQQAWYLSQQLELLKSGDRGGSAYAHIMRAVAERLTDEQIAAVADFYAALPPGGRP